MADLNTSDVKKKIEDVAIIEEKVANIMGDPLIKKYAKGKFLGKGGFAKCYEFTNMETSKVMAAKGPLMVARDFRPLGRIAQSAKDFRLIDTLLTAEDEELTATMKLKRGFVEKKHKPLIDSMY